MQEHHAMALEIRILMSIATRIAGQNLEQRLHAAGTPISGLQHGVLRLLSYQQYTISELGRKLMITPATLVPAIDVLERHGLVVRGQDPLDRRRTPLSLTEQGSDILARLPAVDDEEMLVKSLSAIGPERAQDLLVLLRELVRGMLDSDQMV